MSKKIQIEFTQAEFNKLPALVSRSVFMAWTNYSSSEVTEAVKAGEIEVHHRGKGYGKYYKTDISKITRFKL